MYFTNLQQLIYSENKEFNLALKWLTTIRSFINCQKEFNFVQSD